MPTVRGEHANRAELSWSRCIGPQLSSIAAQAAVGTAPIELLA
jgi:hypothetical protein